MPVGRKITRRKAGTGPTVNYFTTDTHDAIVEFRNEPDIEKQPFIANHRANNQYAR